MMMMMIMERKIIFFLLLHKYLKLLNAKYEQQRRKSLFEAERYLKQSDKHCYLSFFAF